MERKWRGKSGKNGKNGQYSDCNQKDAALNKWFWIKCIYMVKSGKSCGLGWRSLVNFVIG